MKDEAPWYGLDVALERSRLIYRWDLDKTYLRTEFDTARQLVKTAFEGPKRKRTVPGATGLLRELRSTGPAGISILSGSPEQMRRVLEAKLRLDGIRWDSFTLKPSLRNLMRGRFRFLKDQISYKLLALMTARVSADPDCQEILFGDDAEADAFIYSLFADLCAGRVGAEVLMAVLREARVYADDVPGLVRLADRLPRGEAVARIFIHLDRVSSPQMFDEYGGRVCAFHNYFQPSLALLEAGVLDVEAVFRVGAEMVIEHAFSPDTLSASFADLVSRQVIGRESAERIIAGGEMIDVAHFSGAASTLRTFVQDVAAQADHLKPPEPIQVPEIDYVGLFARDRTRAKAAKRRALWRPGD